jgi:hypothetical protein
MERPTPHLQKVQEINSAILSTRNDFIGKYRRKQMGSQLLTYEPGLDRGVYATLKTFQDIPEQSAYVHTRNELNAQTSFSVETFIGERLNVGLSEFRYDLRGGKMYGQGMDESLLDMIQRGRDCRDAIAKDVDRPRQDAEIEQFQKIENLLGNDQTQLGTTVISLSPPGGEGSSYAHNFYDVFVLSEDANTKEKYIAAHRYASDLSLEEYKQRAEELNPGYFAEHKNDPIDSYFLSHPLVLDTKSSLSGKPEDIHAALHKGHEFLSTEDFAEVKRVIAGLVSSYVNTLVENPDDELLLNSHLNYIMNSADDVATRLRRPSTGMHRERQKEEIMGPLLSREDILREGKKTVRSAGTGCGESKAFGTEDRGPSNMSEFSMRDFGTDKLGNRTFDCPDCGEMNVRPVNQTIKECQHCGSSKVAC